MRGFKLSYLNPQKFPLVLEPEKEEDKFEDLIELIKEQKEELEQKLLESGGLLLRGFPVDSSSKFQDVIASLGLGHFLNYIGGDSPRVKVTGEVYTSTEAPPNVKIPLHNELSFVNHYPKHIYFYCETPPEQDGETIIGDAREVLKGVDPEVLKKLKEKGIKYTSRYYFKSKIMDFVNSFKKSHKSWIDVFETDDKKKVEELCKENAFDFKWNPHDWIEISQHRPPVIEHPKTGETVWFNQIHLYDFNPRLLGLPLYVLAKLFYFRKHTLLHEVCYGDGTPIPQKDIYHILDVLDQNTIKFTWKKGDVMILDNILAMHGRATFTGKRRVLTALTG